MLITDDSVQSIKSASSTKASCWGCPFPSQKQIGSSSDTCNIPKDKIVVVWILNHLELRLEVNLGQVGYVSDVS